MHDKQTKIIKQMAIKEALKQEKEVHIQYLHCYPLLPQKKTDCIKKLTEQYIGLEQQLITNFIKEFTYEAEKLGFTDFLRDQGVICNKITEGPIFSIVESAYKVVCVDGNSYYVGFSIDDMETKLYLKQTNQ